VVTLSAAADAGWTFAGFDPGAVVTMDSDKTVTATFTEIVYTLTINKVGNGTVTPDKAAPYHYGDVVTLSAAADAGWTFAGFDPGAVVTMDSDKTVTATFTQTQYTISGMVTVSGSGLADVQMSGLPGDPCTGGSGFYTATVDSGFSAVVTPTKEGYTFDPSSRSYTDVSSDQVGQDYEAQALPSDNFNDNRRGSMWRSVADNPMIWQIEDANQLNIGASGWVDIASSCVGHWKMNDNESSPIVLDSSGKGKNGTAQQTTATLHTTGKIDGALTFNGTTDYVDVGNVVGAGAYTKVAWVKREAGDYYNNIVSSGDVWAHALYAPYTYSFKLSAGHTNPYNQVQDPTPLAVGVWYQVAVTFDPNVSSGQMVLYKNGTQVAAANNVPTQAASTKTYIGRFVTGFSMKGAIDNVMIFNKALTAQEISALYNGGNGTEIISGGQQQASYAANGWNFAVAKDFAFKVDFHYSDASMVEGWIGMSVGDDANYVSISAGSDSNQSYFYYEAVVDGNMVFEQEPRASSDGTLYISYDASLKDFYLSHTGFGSEHAYVWHTSNPLRGQWALPVEVSVGGGSSGSVLGPGEAYLDNFEMAKAGLLGWPPATDIDDNGFIEMNDLARMCENWLDTGAGDVNNDGIVDFLDFAELSLAW
jgi:hypothetical protein